MNNDKVQGLLTYDSNPVPSSLVKNRNSDIIYKRRRDNMNSELKEILSKSNNIVFFGGAGVSTESGIPDFRSVDGLYSQKYKYPPEMMISHSFFRTNPEEFFDFYINKMIFLDAKPNQAHKKLAELEKEGKLKAVITQNIDGLHQ